MAKSKKEVVVLGAGLAGLASAHELAKAGYKVRVYEMFDFIGGLAATIRKGEFAFDTGPHRWFAKSDFVNNWMLDLMKGEIKSVKRLTRIYFDNKYFFYPIKISNALLGIGPIKAFMAIFDYGVYRIRARVLKPKIVSLEDGFVNQFGRTLYNTFFKRYSEKLWGRPNTQISADWAGQRTRGFNLLTVVKDSLFKSKKIVSFVDEFQYPEKGVGRIAEKLAEEVEKMGGKIYLNAKAVSFNANGKNKMTGVEIEVKGKRIMETADFYINTIPLPHLIKFMNPKAPKEIIKESETLKFRSEVQVALFIKKTNITPDVWIYVHSKEISFMRFMEMDNWSNVLSPKGTTTLVFEVACNEDDETWNKSDKELIEMVKNDYIKEFKTIEQKDVLGGYVHRVPFEYPVYHIGYTDSLDKIKEFLDNFTNLQTIGRNGIFRYNNMDHSIEMGLYAAWNIIEGKRKHDPYLVNIEREYLEEKKL
ncbi:MAG: hypothetical protein A2798_01835 [Candidatus Levybacteria bacterium RIFCSPHIGHO2_01_FULL_37_17]|nr:MAG: hypothetical protein A2798_01835 [Candidatus Levybacteria bacterium RIFCSPHIGHO2_01_FULL_37_17]OGH37188.1 MAG: hypothetical protein A2959_02695 [Candidatus Levybacteria bacterium RIFCSPLOWO2_01_FULL_38_23]